MSIADIQTELPVPQIRLEEIVIKIEARGKSVVENIIDVGRLLCEARELLPANKAFGEWREDRLPWMDTKLANRWMNAYRNGGEALIGQNVRTAAIYELTAPSTPPEARQEAIERAESGEEITHKKSKKLKAYQKTIAELESKLTPDINKLIPDLKDLLDKKQITGKMALTYSKMDESEQQAIFSNEFSKQLILKQLKTLEDERENLFEEDRKANQLEIDAARKELVKTKKELREQIETSLRLKIDKEYQDEIIKTRKDKDSAEKEKKEYQKKSNAMAKHITAQDYRIEKLESQIEVNNPTNIDNSRALKLTTLFNELELATADIRIEFEIVGGEMAETKEVLTKIKTTVASLIEDLDEQPAIEIN